MRSTVNFFLGTATIIEDDSSNVIGCVWSIDKSNLPELDRQEGVHQEIYRPIELTGAKK